MPVKYGRLLVVRGLLFITVNFNLEMKKLVYFCLTLSELLTLKFFIMCFAKSAERLKSGMCHMTRNIVSIDYYPHSSLNLYIQRTF